MGLHTVAYTAIRGSGGHISIAGVTAVIGIWRLRQRRIQANVTTTGSGLHMARLPVLQDHDFDLESVWDSLAIPPVVFKALHTDFVNDGGIMGPLVLDVGESGAQYTALTFVLDTLEVINAAADSIRIRVQGSCNIAPLTFTNPGP